MIIVTLRAHSDVFLLLTAAFACVCVLRPLAGVLGPDPTMVARIWGDIRT
jgi:hypothetical protein